MNSITRGAAALAVIGGIAAAAVFAQSGSRQNGTAEAQTQPAQTQQTTGFVMGSGQWTCGDVLQVSQNGEPMARGQLFGWIFGYWSAVSFELGDDFVQSMQAAGAQGIANLTVTECSRQPAEASLLQVSRAIVLNSVQQLRAEQQ